MIHFDPVEEPPDFDARVRRPGRAWLAAHPTARRPRDYWSRVRPALADAFRNLCAYSAMYEPVGTVDHFVSLLEDPSLAYEWSNYRYASGWINASKQHLRAERLLDPFEVEDGWFRILLPSLQLVVDEERVPPEHLERAHYVLERLHLGHDERIVRQRRQWYRLYQEGKLSLDALRELAPLIARAVLRQRREGA